MSLSTESPHGISAMISSTMAWLPSHKGSQAPQSMACATIYAVYIIYIYHNIYKYFQYKHGAIVYLHVLSRSKDHDPNIIKKMKVDNVTLSSLVILDSKFLATPLVSWVHGTGCPRLQCKVFQVLLPIFSFGTSISSYLNNICLVFHASSIIFINVHVCTPSLLHWNHQTSCIKRLRDQGQPLRSSPRVGAWHHLTRSTMEHP